MHRSARVFVALAATIGLLTRLSGLLTSDDRLLQHWPTEDGYLMLQVARNMAEGLGMSTAAGTLPTNGVQPLATILGSGVFWLVDGDRVQGVRISLVLQILMSIAAAWSIHRLARRVLVGRPHCETTAAVAASLWFASPVVLPHTMNCLETALYILLVLTSLGLLLRLHTDAAGPVSLPRMATLGGLLGLCFLARNDAVFFIAAVCLTHLAWDGAARARRFAESCVAGSVSILVASPWLITNQVRFGSIVPISGQSEAMDAHFGHNLDLVPAVLFEYAAVLLPVPSALEREPWVMATATLALVAGIVALIRSQRGWSALERRVAVLMTIYAIGLTVFYGLFFGASHFMARYLAPLSPALAVIATHSSMALLRGSRWRPRAFAAAAAGCLLVITGLSVRLYRNGLPHPHFQVVRWIADNVDADGWVGAIQTGTLGFFHDRTVNLDGKVNPEALLARRAGEIPSYVAERPIDYLVDWVGIAGWAREHPEIAARFEIVVEDEAANLAVLRRKR
jgi:hypothetical protein